MAPDLEAVTQEAGASRKSGYSWDELTMPDVKVCDLDIAAFRAFRRIANGYQRIVHSSAALGQRTGFIPSKMQNLETLMLY
jgi:hypothetical protein